MTGMQFNGTTTKVVASSIAHKGLVSLIKPGLKQLNGVSFVSNSRDSMTVGANMTGQRFKPIITVAPPSENAKRSSAFTPERG